MREITVVEEVVAMKINLGSHESKQNITALLWFIEFSLVGAVQASFS